MSGFACPAAFEAALGRLPMPDADPIAAARVRQASLTKPAGSLGRLEEIAGFLAGWQGTPQPVIEQARGDLRGKSRFRRPRCQCLPGQRDRGDGRQFFRRRRDDQRAGSGRWARPGGGRDGFVRCSAIAPLAIAAPAITDHCLAGHCSAVSGHIRLLRYLDLDPLLSLGMRLGEGSSAAVAVSIIRAALAMHNGMATFAEAGVADSL